VSARVSEQPRFVFVDGVTDADVSRGLKGGNEDVPMPSWKIENAATAAAVALPLLDAAGIVGEEQRVESVDQKKHCVLFAVYCGIYVVVVGRVKCHHGCLWEWRGPRL